MRISFQSLSTMRLGSSFNGRRENSFSSNFDSLLLSMNHIRRQSIQPLPMQSWARCLAVNPSLASADQ